MTADIFIPKIIISYHNRLMLGPNWV